MEKFGLLALGGTGSGLPPVTSSDNGKVLTVVDGAWTAADKSPLVVTYTISGQPVDNIYPLSYSHTLAQIAAAQAAGREVLGTIVMDGNPLTSAPQVRTAASGLISYNIVGISGGALVYGQIVHHGSENTETAQLSVIPISTAQMNFDSSTGTLAITG